MNSKKTGLIKALLLLFMVMVVVGASSATTNMIIITDPTGQDPNGAAAGSMSYAENMFQSTFYIQQGTISVFSLVVRAIQHSDSRQ